MENTVKALLAEIKEIPELAKNLSNDVDIMNEVGLDSLQTVTFLFKLEEAFGIEIDFENFDYADLSSIKCLCDALRVYQQTANATRTEA